MSDTPLKPIDTLVRFCRVESVDDEYGGQRIKVRIPGIDSGVSDEDLPYCVPLLPKLIHVIPKKGEGVFIILERLESNKDNRFYVGPVISQPYFNAQSNFDISGKSLMREQIATEYPNPNTITETIGTLPQLSDVAIEGRANTEVMLRPSELILRCGHKVNPESSDVTKRLNLNSVDPAYIQMKYVKNAFKDNSAYAPLSNEYSSVINIVADRINLLSRDSSDNYNLYATDGGSGQKKILTEQVQRELREKMNDGYCDDISMEMENYTNIDKDTPGVLSNTQISDVVDGAHPLVYGDELIAYLKELINVFKSHTHSWPGKVPCLDSKMETTLTKDLSKYLTKAIKIN